MLVYTPSAYDKTGNLTRDVKEGIDSIYWNVYGKIASIKKQDTIIPTAKMLPETVSAKRRPRTPISENF